MWKKNRKPSVSDSITIHKFRTKVSETINSYPDSSLIYIKKYEKLTSKEGYLRNLTDVDYLYAQYFKRIQKLDSAIIYFNKSIEKSVKIKYHHGISKGYNGLCRTYYLLGKIEESVVYCKKALVHIEQSDELKENVLADTHIALSVAYSRQHLMNNAIEHLLTVDSIHKKTPLQENIIALAYLNLGNIYLEIKDYDSAEKYYFKASLEFKKIPASGVFYFNITNVNLGQVHFHKKQLEKADKLLSNTLLFFEEIKEQRITAEINYYLGLISIETNNLVRSKKHLEDAMKFYEKSDLYFEAAQTAVALGKLYISSGNTDAAISILKEAQTYNKTTKNGLISQKAHLSLAEAYALQGNFEEAFKNFQSSTQINDSIQQAQSIEKIKEIEAVYQTESRDREIALLTTKNDLVVQQKENQRNLLWGIILIIVIAAAFVFFQFKNRQKSTKKLQELDAAKSTFFANISHEFRTPLTLISGPIEDQLNSENISQIERKNLQLAKRNTNRLKHLVDQLLALAKLESGNIKLNIQAGNMPTFVAAQAESFSFSCKEKGINFSIQVVNDKTIDWFDQDILEKIIYNLISNAIKYTPENGFINLLGKRDAEKYEISVINSGNYIPPYQQKKIFERFYQIDRKNSGTGIGLSLTKELTEIHKGKIFFKSEENGITEFNIHLPVAKETYDDYHIFSDVQQQYVSEIPIDPNTYITKTIESDIIINEDAPVILIIDDNREIREYVSSIFEPIYTVLQAKDGKEGFSLATEQIPDLIISDVMMPEADGFTVTKNIKEHQLTSHIPVVLLTAKTHITSKLEAMGIGADSYITKPFSSQLLIATVENLIENRRKLQKRFSQEGVLILKEISVSSADEQFLNGLQKVLDNKITDPSFSVEDFSSEMGVSRMQLHRKLKALTGQSASEFLRVQRLKLGLKLLKENKISISEIGYTIGFNDAAYFSRCFKQEYGCSPKEYISK